ncbi:haloalkane dehalogenase [Parvibaculum sp.]|uniref:haloalkane dehalogenase n=1 Tax=Alphaproteobacteria TaxID=28211 RepID=UPI001B15B3EF|nr:haloalkane dehalogenase [Parvibaculum sp.]MBO6691376.1 haloalkane dehalogenase [Parvibaculum sp.]MBO6715312.1 haloalkane dehalogenase [Parvibaculum sp.]MCK5910970.1 haloalkane dehalogenase [Caulobacter sp.]
MQILRTPDDRFAGLADYPFAPNYAQIQGPHGTSLRLHYVDEGPRDGQPILLLHGEPSWSYLYRKIIPELVARGRRVLAPDLIGFGRSDKPAARTDYTYERHVTWMTEWLVGLDLEPAVLFCQDWGGLIGLRLVAAMPSRFAAVVAANTGLPEGEPVSDAFNDWLTFSQSVPSLPVGAIIAAGCARPLSEGERAAYDAPFPDESYKAGARQFPTLVPVTPEHASVAENRQAWAALGRFEQPFVTAYSDGDPVTAGRDREFQARVPGARGQRHLTLPGGHFLQEDSPGEIADLLDSLAAEAARETA